MTKQYIEYRIYIKDGIDELEVLDVAEELKDSICDSISSQGAPEIFDQDVTYEFKSEIN